MRMTDGSSSRAETRAGQSGEFPLSVDLWQRAGGIAEMSPRKSKAYHIAGQTAKA
jgi:hypothetical protein